MEPTPNCCDVWPKIARRLDWMRFQPGQGVPDLVTMPHLRVDGDAWRINFCPSCGADRHGVYMRPEDVVDY